MTIFDYAKEFGFAAASRWFGINTQSLTAYIKESKPDFKTKSIKGRPRKYYAHDIANALELQSMGFTLDQIGKCFNVSGDMLKKSISLAKKHGIEMYPHKEDYKNEKRDNSRAA